MLGGAPPKAAATPCRVMKCFAAAPSAPRRLLPHFAVRSSFERQIGPPTPTFKAPENRSISKQLAEMRDFSRASNTGIDSPLWRSNYDSSDKRSGAQGSPSFIRGVVVRTPHRAANSNFEGSGKSPNFEATCRKLWYFCLELMNFTIFD